MTEEKRLKSEKIKRVNKENPEQVKRVEAELEESTEEEELTKVTRVGYISMKQKKDWKAFYCLVIGGSFYYYKNSTDPEPKGAIHLAEHKIVSPAPDSKKKYTFIIQKANNPLFIGACSAEPELKSWLIALEKSLTLDKSDPPMVVVQKAKKDGVMKRVKKSAVSKGATSALGKKVMKVIVNDETAALLNALKRIVKTQTGDAKQGEDLEKNIIKLAVKAFLLIENKQVNADDFLVADKPLRESFELMVKVFNGRSRAKDEKIREALVKVEELLKKAEEILTNLLAPYLSSKNMLRISAIFGSVASVEFLFPAFKSPSSEEDLDKLIDAMEYYTQFHYH